MVVSEHAVVPADVIERVGLPGAVPGVEVQAEGLLGMAKCIGGMVLIVEHPAEDQVGFRLAKLVVELCEQGQGLLEVGAGHGMAAERLVGAAEVLVSEGFAEPVGLVSVRRQGGVLGGGQVMPLPLAGEVVRQRPGQLPGAGAPAGDGGQLDGGKQHRILGLEPGPGCCVAGRLRFRRYSGLGRRTVMGSEDGCKVTAAVWAVCR